MQVLTNSDLQDMAEVDTSRRGVQPLLLWTSWNALCRNNDFRSGTIYFDFLGITAATMASTYVWSRNLSLC